MDRPRNAIGRPRRADRSKRDDLLDAARAILRRRPYAQLMRTELAASSRTAPALVSYYFKDEASLFHAAVEPVVEGYLRQLIGVFGSGQDSRSMLRHLIDLLVRIARDDGHLVEGYINYVKQHGIVERSAFLIDASIKLDAFFRRCFDDQLLKPQNSAFMQTALWGICKTIAQTPELTTHLQSAEGGEAEVLAVQVDLIMALVTHGAASS